MRIDIGRIRTVLFAVPVAAVAVVSVVALFAVLLPPGSVLEFEEVEPLKVSTEGSSVRITGYYEVGSHLGYDIDDLSVSVHVVDRSNGSDVRVWEASGLKVPSGGMAPVDIDARILMPTLYLVLSELALSEGSTVPLEVRASCTYMAGLLDISVSADLEVSLSEKGKTLDFGVERNDPYVFVAYVRNVASWIPLPDIDITAAGGGSEMHLSVRGGDGRYAVTVESPDGLDAASRAMSASGMVVSGDYSAVLDGDQASLVMHVLDWIRGDSRCSTAPGREAGAGP